MDNGIKKLSFKEIKAARPSIEQLKMNSRFPVAVVLDKIRSIYNVGAIFRTSDGALIDKLYLCGYTASPPRKEIEKTALGSTESVPWEHCPQALDVIKDLKKKGYQIVSLEHTNRSLPYTTAQYKFPLCLVVGNEVEGISDEIVELCDMAVEIPMHGIKQSLNVAVAYGIMAYHLIAVYKGDYVKNT
jgi:tRNA G18 (ribose-2'-O)-methylase SpoU